MPVPVIMVLQVLGRDPEDHRADRLLVALGRRLGHKQLRADPNTGTAKLWMDMSFQDANAALTGHLDDIDDDWSEHLHVISPPPS